MEPLDDYPLGVEHNTVPANTVDEGRGRGWAVLAVAFIIVAALAAFIVMRPSTEPVGETTRSGDRTAAAMPGAPDPLGPAVPPRELPPLDLTDPLVRELLSGLSSRPEIATWLATDGLVRNFVATVDTVANGGAPSPHLRRLAPAQEFAVQPQGSGVVIDPRSFQRYDGLADTVAALDADGLARAYSTLKPRLQEAYRELGYPDGNFDVAVERAIAQLLDTPVADNAVRVQRAPVLYQFVDPRLERLSGAQKQLLRMGPRNGRIVQEKLRAVAQALGLRAELSR